jgi:hypothetical protein
VRLQSRAHSAHTSKIETNDLWNGHHSRDKSHVRQKHAKTIRCSANIFSSIENSIISLSTTANLSSIVRAAWHAVTNPGSPSRLPSTLPIADHVVTRRASVAAPSDGTEKAPASHPVLETPAVAKAPRSESRQKPQARANLVSATIDLVPDKLALIRQHCSAQTAGSAIRFRWRSKTICASHAKLLSGMRTMGRQ